MKSLFDKPTRTETQADWVLKQLLAGRKLTAKDAMDERGIMQMATRVFELKDRGYEIKSPRVKVRDRTGAECHVALYQMPNKHISSTLDTH